MKFSNTLIAFCLVLLSPLPGLAQVKISEEKASFPLFNAYYAFQMPGHDLAERFGNNSMIGGGFLYKFKSNLLAGVEGGFLFSENVKNSDEYLKLIASSEGYVISEGGTFAGVFFHQRGFNISARFGGIIPVVGPNPNSGLMLLGGLGILQHKIRIEISENNVPQLRDDYKKGYDRLTNGLSISQFIGYVHFGNNRTVNFHIGLEFTQAWTKSRRPFDFDHMQADTQKRFDSLWGIRLGWVLPLIKRSPQAYYYY
ncbi:MAG: hypothetical protein IH597_11140 [Bacteroidales bacterium]|nr:hypothetical protein [Bacteroidales bacterium]